MTRRNLLRLCAYPLLAALVLLFALHPYTRQTVVGPRIRRIPFAYWQDQFRYNASPVYRASYARFRAWVGMKPSAALLTRGPDMLPLVLSLRDDPDEYVRVAVARQLGDFPDSAEADDTLLHLLADPSAKVCYYATLTLANRPALHARAVPGWRARLNEESLECRVAAACGICCGTSPPDAPARTVLREAMDGCADPHMQEALSTFVPLLAEKSVAVLEQIIHDLPHDPKLQPLQFRLLLIAGTPALPMLVKMLSDDDVQDRLVATMVLASLGPRAAVAVPALVEALADNDPRVRQSARQALTRIDPERARQLEEMSDPAR